MSAIAGRQNIGGTSSSLYLYLKSGAEGRSRTDTGLPPPVFETGASTIPPLRLERGRVSDRRPLLQIRTPCQQPNQQIASRSLAFYSSPSIKRRPSRGVQRKNVQRKDRWEGLEAGTNTDQCLIPILHISNVISNVNYRWFDRPVRSHLCFQILLPRLN